MSFSGRWTEASAGIATLVLASGTLVCCALPILLVTLGMGASVAALVSAAPWLVTLSHYKGWMFAISAVGRRRIDGARPDERTSDAKQRR